jgi:hypothetical protein
MAHTEKRSSPLREGGIAIFTGAIYGAVHTLSGHPLDNIKAKLQMDARYHGKTMFGTVQQMWAEGKARAFWRGTRRVLLIRDAATAFSVFQCLIVGATIRARVTCHRTADLMS